MFGRHIVTAVVIGGGLGGLLDIIFAIALAAHGGIGPGRVFLAIASGALGKAAYSGGAGTKLLGVAFHSCLSIAWSAAFLLIAFVVPAATRNIGISAVAYGATVFVAMRLVVLPLSAYPRSVTFPPVATALDLVSHMVLFAGPIVWAISRELGPPPH